MEKPIRIVPDAKHPRMYRLWWRNGDLSRDMYNLTRATDILRCYERYLANMATGARSKGIRRAGCCGNGAERVLEEEAV